MTDSHTKTELCQRNTSRCIKHKIFSLSPDTLYKRPNFQSKCNSCIPNIIVAEINKLLYVLQQNLLYTTLCIQQHFCGMQIVNFFFLLVLYTKEAE